MNCTHEFRPFLPPDLLHWPNYKDKDLDQAQQAALREKEAACQKSLLEFVRGGKGLVGIHGANVMVQWPEYMEMIGGKYACHFVNKVWIRTDEPGHPLCAVMKDKSFELREEIYGFGPPSFSREKVHVLLDLDLSRGPVRRSSQTRITPSLGSVPTARAVCSIARWDTLPTPIRIQTYCATIWPALSSRSAI